MSFSLPLDHRAAGLRLPPVRVDAQSSAAGDGKLPQVSGLVLRLFTRYSRWYVKRHFHSVRVLRQGESISQDDSPLVVYANHASWWDPLICLLLRKTYWPERNAYAPIDAAMLERYKFFQKLGFFGVEPNTVRGARRFLRASEQILQHPGSLLAITPQGRFADSRERPVQFEAGLGHLARRTRARFVPLALEYVFWEERLPEVLVHFGDPIEVGRGSRDARSARDWTALFERGMELAQNQLARAALSRDVSQFRSLLSGSAGQGGMYDLWRWAKSRLQHREFRKEHGTK